MMQRSVRVGRLARPIFDSLLEIVQQEEEEEEAKEKGEARDAEANATEKDGRSDSEGPLNAAFLEHLLGTAKFHRRDDLPYPKILEMVGERRRPLPANAVAVLENLFPFDNLDDTATALRALVKLQTAALQPHGDDKGSVQDTYRYVVDVSTLETIGAAAARRANVELSLLVWDAVHVMGHPRGPATLAMYENLALVFSAHRPHYGSAFAVLAEMHERGYPVPRALIRSMSKNLRYWTNVFFVCRVLLRSTPHNSSFGLSYLQ
jgi:hypothetical protein